MILMKNYLSYETKQRSMSENTMFLTTNHQLMAKIQGREWKIDSDSPVLAF